MQSILVKICGHRVPSSVSAAARFGASHVGFVFDPRSRRYMPPDQLAAVAAVAPPGVLRVGVYVDADDALIDATIAQGNLNILQLHGGESVERVASLQRRTGLPVWKAVGVRTTADIVAAQAYAQIADLLLYDAKPMTIGEDTIAGGTGQRFDWSLLRDHQPLGPWGLAGGLDPTSVVEALRCISPSLVDVSSGVESAPGVKSPELIAQFLKAAHA